MLCKFSVYLLYSNIQDLIAYLGLLFHYVQSMKLLEKESSK